MCDSPLNPCDATETVTTCNAHSTMCMSLKIYVTTHAPTRESPKYHIPLNISGRVRIGMRYGLMRLVRLPSRNTHSWDCLFGTREIPFTLRPYHVLVSHVTHTHEIAFLGLMRLTLLSDHLYSRNSVSHVKTDRESPKYQRDQDRLQGREDYRMPGRTTSGRASRAAVRHRGRTTGPTDCFS